MISFLRGKVHEISGKRLILDVSGVGYDLLCTQKCSEALVIGKEASVIVHTDVREDAIRLYAFADKLEKETFSLLLGVKGVGTKSAVEILSSIPARDLLRSIGEGDSVSLQSVKGIGKKIADRVILELRDRVVESVMSHGHTSGTNGNSLQSDALAALVTLGFSRKDADTALQKSKVNMGENHDVGELVKEALRHI